MTTHMFPQTHPQQFVSAGSGRNPWATPSSSSPSSFQQSKSMSKPKLPTLVPIQLEPTKVPTTATATPKQKPSKAPPVASPDEFIQLGNNRGGKNWNVAQVNKPAPVPLQKKKFVAVTVAPEVVTPVPAPVVIPIPEPQLPQVPTPAGTPAPLLEDDLTAQNLYKTELCRSFEETGNCRYGTKCQFAHGRPELRPVMRHPKYKTEVCKTFHTVGTCPYGKRCRFIHTRAELPAPTVVVPATAVAAPVAVQAVPVALPVALIDTKDWTSSWTAPKPTDESQRVMVKPISKHNATVPVTQKAASIVFPVQETKTVEQFMPVTAPIFLPSFPVRDFAEIPPQLPIKEEAIIAVVTEAPVLPTAVVPVEAATPSVVVAPISSPTLEEEDEDEEDAVSRGLGSRLSIFAQICSNDE